MLGDADVDALIHARHGDPFAVLGLHADEAGRLVGCARCCPVRPGGDGVRGRHRPQRWPSLALAPSGRAVGRPPSPRRRRRFDYRLRVTVGRWPRPASYADAYSHGPLLEQ